MLGCIEPVAFIEHVHTRHMIGPYLFENTSDGRALPILFGVGGVDHMKQQIGLGDLFEGLRGMPRPARVEADR